MVGRKKVKKEYSGQTPTEETYARLAHEERIAVLEILKQGRNFSNIVGIAANAVMFAESAVERIMNLFPPPQPLKCKVGCAWCCYLRISATVPEVICIAEFLKEQLSPDHFRSLREKIQELKERTGGMSDDDRKKAQLPCALLANNRCLVYPVRPLACRGWNSMDATKCEQAYATPSAEINVPVYGSQWKIMINIGLGLSQGLLEAGLEAAPLELISGLHIALNTSYAAQMWLAGERIFRKAELRLPLLR